ncbi:hypothetical protein TNCV_515101 [Trichonephila clavipes]|nr:hypothetical protein TNCV_515101 [Trichonephila clavipes]
MKEFNDGFDELPQNYILFHQQVQSVNFQLCCDSDPVKVLFGNKCIKPKEKQNESTGDFLLLMLRDFSKNIILSEDKSVINKTD